MHDNMYVYHILTIASDRNKTTVKIKCFSRINLHHAVYVPVVSPSHFVASDCCQHIGGCSYKLIALVYVVVLWCLTIVDEHAHCTTLLVHM